jgi:hypothetical protein
MKNCQPIEKSSWPGWPGLRHFVLNFVDPQKRAFNRVGNFYQSAENVAQKNTCTLHYIKAGDYTGLDTRGETTRMTLANAEERVCARGFSMSQAPMRTRLREAPTN